MYPAKAYSARSAASPLASATIARRDPADTTSRSKSRRAKQRPRN